MSSTSATFRAAVVTAPGDTDAISIIDVPVVPPAPGEVRVAVEAATVDPVDLAVRSGVLHQAGVIAQPEHTGLGWDFAGTVLEAGAGVDLAPGTRVAGLVGGSRPRLRARTPRSWCSRRPPSPAYPDGLGLVEAATVPLNALTAAQLVRHPRRRRRAHPGPSPARPAPSAPTWSRSRWPAAGRSPAWPAPPTKQFVPRPRRRVHRRAERPAGTRWPTRRSCRSRPSPWSATAACSSASSPRSPPPPERGVEIRAVSVEPDGERLAGLLDRTATRRAPRAAWPRSCRWTGTTRRTPPWPRAASGAATCCVP